MPDLPAEYTVLAFDYGEMRVGVAVGNSMLLIPHPLATICAKGSAAKIGAIAPLVEKWQPGLLVIGMPGASDNPQKIQLINTITNFARRLSERFNLDVEIVNEDFSSLYASSQLVEQGIYGKKQKGKLDQLAACSILAAFFAKVV